MQVKNQCRWGYWYSAWQRSRDY